MAVQLDKQKKLNTSEVIRKTDLFFEHYGSEIVKEYVKNEALVQASWLKAIFGSNESTGLTAATAAINVTGSAVGAGVVAGTSFPTAVTSSIAGVIIGGTKGASGIYSKMKAGKINRSLTKMETAVNFGMLGGLALRLIFEQQITMIDTDAHIKAFGNYATEVTLKYFKKCTEKHKAPDVNELIMEFSYTKSFSCGKVQLITGETCKIDELITKAEPREMVRGRWHCYTDGKTYQPKKYGYRTGIIQWPFDNDSFKLILPAGTPVEENTIGYQPKFLIVGKYEWDDYCKNATSKSFNEHVKEKYKLKEEIRAVFLPKENLQELRLTMPNREGTEADFSKTILPFFKRGWLKGTHDMLDLTHVNFKGTVLDGASLENTKLQKITGSSISFAVLDGTDLSTFIGDFKCLYPQSCNGMILTIETLVNRRSNIYGFGTEDIEVTSCAEESRGRVEAVGRKLLQLHESLPFEIAEHVERVLESIQEGTEKIREETRTIVTNDGDKTRKDIKDLREKLLKRGPMATEGTQQTAIDDLKVRLSGIIYDQYSKIPNWTLHSDHITTPIDEIYVDITLTKDGKRKCEEKLNSYRDIFEKVSQRRTIYLSAKPGAGKTTLVQRMCVDWAKRNRENPVEARDLEGFDHFDLVLPIFLRHVTRGQNLTDVITEEYRLDAKDAELLSNFIDQNQSSVCILLDGTDEYNEEMSKDITDIIHRRKLSNTTIFITSRYSSESIYDEDRHGPDMEIKMKGFSEHGIEDFIRKYFQNEDMEDLEVDTLLKEMEGSLLLEHLKHLPAVLLMVLSLWKIQQKLPSTLTNLYKEFVAFIFARLEKKKIKKVKNREKTTDTLIEKYHEYLIKFGELGQQNIREYRLKLEFSENDISEYISTDDLKVGLLTEEHTLLRQRYYSYLHKTLQEFLVSFYFFHSEESKQVDMFKYFCCSHAAFKEFSMMRRFLLGLGGEQMFNQIQSIIPTVYKSYMLPILQLDYLTENPEATIELPEVVHLSIRDDYPESILERYFSMDGTALDELEVEIYVEYLSLILELDAPCLTSFSLDTFTFPKVSLAGLEDVLDHILNNFCALETLKLSEETLCSCLSDILDLYTDDGLNRTLEHLHLNSIYINDSYFITDQIKGLARLQSLTISECILDVDNLYTLVWALPPTVKYLDVSQNSFSPPILSERREEPIRFDHPVHFMFTRKELGHSWSLRNLNSVNIKETTEDFGFSTSSTFQSLCIDSIDPFELMPVAIRAIFYCLPHKLRHIVLKNNNLQCLFLPTEKGLLSTQLQSLDLTSCNLTSSHVETIFKTMPWTLREVILSHNDLRGLSMITEQTRLPTSKLQLLDISNCSLKQKDAFFLFRNFPTTLRMLDMSRNMISLALLVNSEDIKTGNFRMEQLNIFKI